MADNTAIEWVDATWNPIVGCEPALDQPLRWKRARRIFVVCASGDLFYEAVPDAWIDQVFAVMALAPQHKFLVLTKRAKRMREYMTEHVKGPWAGRAHVVGDDGIERPMTDVHFRMNSVMCDLYPKVPPQALNFASDWADRHYPDGDGFLRQWPLPNVWLGVSAEDQARADPEIYRAALLTLAEAGWHTFVSYEDDDAR